MQIKLEDLEINNYMIYQDKDSFNFGIDAVLLANFVLNNFDSASYNKDGTIINICDLCTGNLPIPLIMYAKRKDFFPCDINIDALEINKNQVKLCNDTLKYNYDNNEDAKKIMDDIKVINMDIKDILVDSCIIKNEFYDIVTCNPPYIKKGSGIVNKENEKMIAKHEILVTFDEICKIAAKILKSNKKFYFIHHSERFAEIVETLSHNGFKIKKVQFVYPNINVVSNLVLIEAVKNANSGTRVLPPIIL